MACCQVLPCRSVSGIQSIECTSIWPSRPRSCSSAIVGSRDCVAICCLLLDVTCLESYNERRFPLSQPLFHKGFQSFIGGPVSSASNGNDVPDAVPDGTRIGAQLRAARLAARMSMAEVAEQAGLTKGFVSKLERDLANVSVASLIRLCDALGVSVGSLFQAPKGEVVRRGARPRINFGGRKMTEYLLTPSGEKRVQAILSDIEPGGGSMNE